MTSTWALYSRVSTTDQLDGMSIDAQSNALRKWADAHGYAVREFVDAGKSAWTDDLARRPVFSSMLDAARAGEIAGIAVTHLDRFSRKLIVTLSALGELGRLNVGFVSLENVSFDFSRPTDRLMLVVLGAFAEYYSAELSRKIKRGLEHRAEQGLRIGALEFGYCNGACAECRNAATPCPRFGKTNGAIIAHPDDAPGVSLAFETYYSAIVSFDDVARVLNAAGYRSKSANGRALFNKHSVDVLLSNISYTGVVSFNGREIPGQHPALISRELFDAVQAIRHARSSARIVSNRGRQTYLLAGIVRCAGCGRVMRAQYHTKNGVRRWLYYRCTTNELLRGTCPHAGAWINEDELEPQIAEIVAQFELPADWLNEVTAALSANGKPAPNGDSRAKLTERLARVKEQYEWGDVSRTEYVRKRDEIKSALQARRAPRVAEVIDAANLLSSMRDVWEVATPEECRDMLRTILESVECDPTARRIVALKPKPVFRLLFRRVRGLREDGDLFRLTDVV